jgi:hypothetical protein
MRIFQREQVMRDLLERVICTIIMRLYREVQSTRMKPRISNELLRR